MDEIRIRRSIEDVLRRYGEVGASVELLSLEGERGVVVVLGWTDGSPLDAARQARIFQEIERIEGVAKVTVGLASSS